MNQEKTLEEISGSEELELLSVQEDSKRQADESQPKLVDNIDGAFYRLTYGIKNGSTTYFYKVYAISGPYRTKETAPVGQTTKIAKK